MTEPRRENTKRLPGISAAELAIVRRILSGFPKVCVFGSRATGKHRPFSDLDLCILGETPVSDATMDSLREAFQESDLPYKVDIVDVHSMTPEFKKSALATAIVIFEH